MERDLTAFIRSSFLHLPGIGVRREALLRASGIRDWQDLSSTIPNQLDLYGKRGGRLHQAIEESELALEQIDLRYFADRLPRREWYRLAVSFPEKCVFLDIETTGLSRYYDDVTVIGWSRENSYTALVEPKTIDQLEEQLLPPSIIVTFNGSLFDLPFLKSKCGLDFDGIPHIDLRFLARRVGLSGGQKYIEREIGVSRIENLKDVDGAQAVTLWFDYKEGDLSALKKLIRYNHADVEGMKDILRVLLERLLDDEAEQRVPPIKRSRLKFQNGSGKGIEIGPYTGSKGPRLSLDTLISCRGRLRKMRVVGIDLTGSEKRKSGWALVEGENLQTELLSTDQDIVDRTMEVKPDLVSIDSPLSLPAGRIEVSDSDPGRDEFGIMRQAERQLKRRGINVYPALLPSMQKLTERGIRIARTLRGQGVSVIESYPGAAQDILGIPRKKTSLKHLRLGLCRFGYVAEPDIDSMSHDELDAATSALVGQFLLAGYFELLGREDEDFMVVPTTHVDAAFGDAELVVGISGPLAAGKTTVAEMLVSQGFEYCRFSQILADKLSSESKPQSRQALQELGSSLHDSPFGQRWLQNKLADRVKGNRRIVIDGLRHPEDHAFLLERWGIPVAHLHIDTELNARRSRYLKREAGELADFLEAEDHAVEQNVTQLSRLAGGVISNNGSISELEERLRLLMKDIAKCQ